MRVRRSLSVGLIGVACFWICFSQRALAKKPTCSHWVVTLAPLDSSAAEVSPGELYVVPTEERRICEVENHFDLSSDYPVDFLTALSGVTCIGERCDQNFHNMFHKARPQGGGAQLYVRFPGKDGFCEPNPYVYPGDDVIIDAEERNGMNITINRIGDGEVDSFTISFGDVVGERYSTDLIVPQNTPWPQVHPCNGSDFVIHLHADAVKVYPRKGPRKPQDVVGTLSVGDIWYHNPN